MEYLAVFDVKNNFVFGGTNHKKVHEIAKEISGARVYNTKTQKESKPIAVYAHIRI